MAETEQTLAGSYLDELIAAVQDGKRYSFTHYVPFLRENMFFTCVPFTVGNTTTPWTLMVGIPTGIITQSIYQMLIFSVVIAVVMMLITSVGAIFLSRSISRPLNHMVTILGHIGEGDLTQRLDISSKDEIGEMTGSFNNTLGKIRLLIQGRRARALRWLPMRSASWPNLPANNPKPFLRCLKKLKTPSTKSPNPPTRF
jgi:methyl-accepting chemotaxis protein